MNRTAHLAFSLCVALALVPTALRGQAPRAPASTVRSLTVESLRGEGSVPASALKTCLGDSQIRVGDDAIPFDELLFLRFARTAPLPRPRPQPGRVEFVLENGDRIVGRVERAGADDVEVSSAAWGGKRIEPAWA